MVKYIVKQKGIFEYVNRSHVLLRLKLGTTNRVIIDEAFCKELHALVKKYFPIKEARKKSKYNLTRTYQSKRKYEITKNNRKRK